MSMLYLHLNYVHKNNISVSSALPALVFNESFTIGFLSTRFLSVRFVTFLFFWTYVSHLFFII